MIFTVSHFHRTARLDMFNGYEGSQLYSLNCIDAASPPVAQYLAPCLHAISSSYFASIVTFSLLHDSLSNKVSPSIGNSITVSFVSSNP